MAKTAFDSTVTGLALDPGAAQPLFRQLQDGLRRAVLEGRLAAGARLPSTRTLAADLGVSRNTVVAAYEQLVAEGYLEGMTGSGTRVSAALPDAFLDAGAPEPAAAHGDGGLAAVQAEAAPGRAVPFAPGMPALDAFPHDLWRRLANRVWRRADPALFGYGEPAGLWPLRQAVAAYLSSARGVRCGPGQVIVVSGSQQALDLSVRLLLRPGAAVLFEDPGYLGARGVFDQAAAELVPVPVDAQGMDVAAGLAARPDAAMAYVTPSCQYPLGGVLSLERRLELLDWARRRGAWIVEDDYNSEYRYAGRPLPALQGLDEAGRVIYMGSFSKVLFPALRLGYLVLPPDLVARFRVARRLTDGAAPALTQAALAEFMAQGHFGAHLRRMRKLYLERRDTLTAALAASGLPLDWTVPESGMHLVARLAAGRDDKALSGAAAGAGIAAPPLSVHYAAPPRRGGLLLGFAGFAPAALAAAVAGLRRLPGF
ncbi:MAG: PLP-dependent aminotransferase family protein [Hyphomicrobiales bacterium]|nr:PLP-dependent aminotransferase family protein [Hyphomicrobiales bacterium]